MGTGCYNCKNLKEKDKKEGNIGALYFCSKQKKYVSGAYECDKYALDYTRKQSVKDQIYREGLKYSNDKTSIGAYMFVLICLLILGIILGIFKF